ncbi:MAG: hypothetical protein OEQ29_11190 [Alphaproteobacteria bacterium]|nr:hypothetical protein [Alphaproteobacteria bacterium]
MGLLATVHIVLELSAGPARAQDTQDSVESFKNARGGTLRYLVTLPPGPVDGIVILFVGGNGRLKLDGQPEPKSNNFLVRSRRHFADRGFVVALPDAPSDRGPAGLVGWRTSRGHIADIGMLARRLRARWPVPVWLIGTSRGAISAATGGAQMPGIAGVVLTASVTKPSRRRPQTVFDAPIRQISVPALVVHHRSDACRGSPVNGAGRLFARLTASTLREIRMIDGGRPAESGPCGGLSAHGFYGAERKTVREIVKWIGIFQR